MNKIVLIGRICKDLEVKTTQSQVAVCSFTVAVDRKFKNANGEREADFLNCVAWRQQAEFLGKYFHKGSKVALTGSLQARSYDGSDGKKIYVTEIIVDEAEFVDSKQTGTAEPNHTEAKQPVWNDDTDNTSLPFDL